GGSPFTRGLVRFCATLRPIVCARRQRFVPPPLLPLGPWRLLRRDAELALSIVQRLVAPLQPRLGADWPLVGRHAPLRAPASAAPALASPLHGAGERRSPRPGSPASPRIQALASPG